MLDSTSTLAARLDAVRATALSDGIPVRRKDGRLYGLLADCLALCEDVIRNGEETELRELVRVSVDLRGQGNSGKGRRYAETGSDAFILVARYVLSGVDGRNSFYRYAGTLRTAFKRGIASSALAEWLQANGGVNALYIPGGNRAATRQTKTLHLNRRITFPREGVFTLTLRHDGKGFFDVVTA